MCDAMKQKRDTWNTHHYHDVILKPDLTFEFNTNKECQEEGPKHL